MLEIIKQAATLRGKKQFSEAIKLVEDNLSSIDPDVQVVALMQAFYAAVEDGNNPKAKEFALKIVELEPDLPSIQKYL